MNTVTKPRSASRTSKSWKLAITRYAKDLIVAVSTVRDARRSVFRLGLTSLLFSLMIAPLTTVAAPTNQNFSQVLSSGCAAAPRNMSLSDFWESKLGVLEAWCDYPVITAANINGQAKPRAYLNGSANVPHDLDVGSIVNGTGNNGDELGFAPNTPVSFGLYCSDAGQLANTKPADVAFSLRAWSSSCQLTNPSVPLIPIFGGLDGNNSTFIGNVKTPNTIHLSSGGNYGQAIDYYTPGGASTVLGGGNVSYALPELGAIIVALNTVLISKGKAPLTRSTVKEVLDASSDEVYLEVNGTRAIYKENQVGSLLQNPSNKYYGQIVNLPNAIEYALTGSVTGPPPPPPPPPPPGQVAATLIPVYALLLD